jgi:oligopeptide/dipeptide ABC transporter ATP-binding protein
MTLQSTTAGPDRPGERLLCLSDVHVAYPGSVQAVRGVSVELAAADTVAVIGESGSGKSSVVGAVFGTLPPQTQVGGSVRYRDTELLTLTTRRRRAINGRKISLIPQSIKQSLDPMFRVGSQLGEVLVAHGISPNRKSAARLSEDLLATVGIPDPRRTARAYPHELSGGMAQRVLIAMATAGSPEVLIADEPTTALDTTVQAQIIELIGRVREAHGTALVVITHNIMVARALAEQVLVMYAGRVVERGRSEDLLERPQHPYTVALLGAITRLDDPDRRPVVISGAPPDPRSVGVGCPFAPRCPRRTERCLTERPELSESGAGTAVACHHPHAGPGSDG